VSSYALAKGYGSFNRAATFQYLVGRIRQRDGYIDYTRFGPVFIPGS
jgi:hypothetical protein